MKTIKYIINLILVANKEINKLQAKLRGKFLMFLGSNAGTKGQLTSLSES